MNDEAWGLAQAAVQQDPGSQVAYILSATALNRLKRTTQSEQMFLKGIALLRTDEDGDAGSFDYVLSWLPNSKPLYDAFRAALKDRLPHILDNSGADTLCTNLVKRGFCEDALAIARRSAERSANNPANDVHFWAFVNKEHLAEAALLAGQLSSGRKDLRSAAYEQEVRFRKHGESREIFAAYLRQISWSGTGTVLGAYRDIVKQPGGLSPAVLSGLREELVARYELWRPELKRNCAERAAASAKAVMDQSKDPKTIGWIVAGCFLLLSIFVKGFFFWLAVLGGPGAWFLARKQVYDKAVLEKGEENARQEEETWWTLTASQEHPNAMTPRRLR